MFKLKLLFIFLFVFLQHSVNAAVMQEGEFVKQKRELSKLKKELDDFYKLKEKEYQQNKQELQAIDLNIKKQLEEVKLTKEENQKILDEIEMQVVSKAMKLYGKMKVKIVHKILQEKIDNGNINDVFDIIIRLKEKRVMKLMKMFDTKTSTELMNMISDYKSKNSDKLEEGEK
jgi:flagellar motility protein MotE (MotC chaperone)